jgi:hypothetical protein
VISSALFEAFFVVLGVVLALAANEWREKRAEQAHAEHALEAITEELRTNRQAIVGARDYHEGRMTAIREAMTGGDALSPRNFPRGFVSPAQLFQTAWDAASETGALANLDFATVLALSRVYESQDRYEDQARMVGQLVYTRIFNEGMEAIVADAGNLASIISTFAYRERELLEHYDAVLESAD